MRLWSPFTTLLCLLALASEGLAQQSAPAEAAPQVDAEVDAEVDADAEEPGPGKTGGQAPAAAAPAPEAPGAVPASEQAQPSDDEQRSAEPAPALVEPTPPAPPVVGPAPDLSVPTPGDLDTQLDAQIQDTFDAPDTWTAPTPVFTLHGYMRTRLELMDTFWLGRDIPDGGAEPDPFTRFRAIERRTPETACPGEGTVTEGPSGGESRFCDIDTIRYANMRLRLSPELALTEDVRVKSTFDVFDNVVMGSAPVSFYDARAANAQAGGVFADTSAGGTIIARRAWAEVRNRDLGELRFGRMPQQWGLGMLYNAGNGLDHDYSTDVDRLLVLTKLAGLYFGVSYDFLSEGATGVPGSPGLPNGENRPTLDLSQIDDSDQWTFSVSRNLDDEDRRNTLERGDMVLEGGLQLRMRSQEAFSTASTGTDALLPIRASHYTPDLWGRLQWRGIKIGLEAAWVLGTMEFQYGGGDSDTLDISSAGGVLESEFRFVDDRLGVHFDSGLATGDPDVEGLSSDADFIAAQRNKTISTFRFHPSYQVDMILWRNIMRQVTGAYYFKPGVSYDFVRDEFGQLFGARLDFIWSRATSFIQAPGNQENLGLELNAKIFWISDDGPDASDGYNASLQYGVLFPMQGLGYAEQGSTNLDLAQQLRMVLGVTF